MNLWARQGIVGVTLGIFVFAALFVPIVAWQYRRYGRFSWPRLLGAAACALFGSGLIAYTLLPMPVTSAQWCADHAIRHAELVPGNSVVDAMRHIEGMSPVQALRSPYVLQIVFNVALFVPLGVILRRYLGRSVVAATLIGAAVSVFIETTQYTGVWGLADCTYRLADVDDVIANTLGALLGALVAPALLWWMPTARRLQAQRHEPRPVSGPRRLAGMLIDVAAFLAVSVLTVVAVVVAAAVTGTPMAGDRTPGSEWLLTIGIPFVIVVLLPALTPSGASIGQRVVWLRPESETGGGFGLWRRVARICAATLPVVVVRSLGVLGVGGRTELWSLAAIGLTLFIAAFALVDREHRGLSGRLAGVRYVDVRADRARGDQPVAASASSPARPLATRR